MPLSTRSKRFLRWGLTAAVVAVVGVFFWRSLSRNWDRVAALDLRFDGWTVVACVVFALAVVLSGLLWGAMTSELARRSVGWRDAIAVHCLSWTLKYVPGQVGSAVNKLAWATTRGYSRVLVLLTFVYENLFLLIGSLVPPVIVLLAYGSLDLTGSQSLVVALAALVPLVALTNRRVMRFATNLLARRTLKKEVPDEYFLSGPQALKYQLLYLLPRVINGAGIAILAASLLGSPPSTWLPLACAYVVAGAVGIMAVFVPSGIGVRESVMVLLSTPFIPQEQAIVLALAARLIATIADVLVVGTYLVLRTSATKGSTT